MCAKKEEIICHEKELKSRFESCLSIEGTRSFHRYVPVSESIMRCFLTSKSAEFLDYHVSQIISMTLKRNDTVACIYDGKWWLGEIEDV